MEGYITFKDGYSAEELAEYHVIKKDYMRYEFIGVGDRDLSVLEESCIRDVIENIDANGEEERVMWDLVEYLRTNDTEGMCPEEKDILSQLRSMVINLVRHRLIPGIGIVESLAVSSVGSVHVDDVLEKELEDIWQDARQGKEIVQKFNAGNLSEEDSKLPVDKIIPFIKQGIQNDVVMFLQSSLYFDMQAICVFDDYSCVWKGRRFEWRQFVNNYTYPYIDFDLWFNVVGYCSIEQIVEWKYINKKFLCYYWHFRSRRHCSPKSGESGYVLQPLRGVPCSVDGNHLLFFCSGHGKFFCPHYEDKESGSMVVEHTHLFSRSLIFLRDIIAALSQEERSLLIGMVSGRDHLTVVVYVVQFLVSKGRISTDLRYFVKRNRRLLVYGAALSLMECTYEVVDTLTHVYCTKTRIYLDRFKNMDARCLGFTMSDRIKTNQMVIDRFRDSEVIQSNRIVPASTKMNSTVRKRGKKFRNGRKK